MRKFTSLLTRVMLTVKQQKSELRANIPKKLYALSNEEKSRQSDVVVQKVFSLTEFQESRRISIFLSTPDEIDTKPIVERIFATDKQCFIPRYSKQGMEMVKLHSMQDWKDLPLTSWKIKQPELKEERENALDTGCLDLMIVPGVAFTKDGKRLGHGGGYYDRYIQNLRRTPNKSIFIIGVAFREQILDNIPHQEHDQIIDLILFAE